MFKLLFGLNGRVGRVIYAITQVAFVVSVLGLGYVSNAAYVCTWHSFHTTTCGNAFSYSPVWEQIALLLLFAVRAWIDLAITTKRFHDVNMSWRWAIALWCVYITASEIVFDNFYNSTLSTQVTAVVLWIVVLVANFPLLVLKKGTHGTNQYGPEH